MSGRYSLGVIIYFLFLGIITLLTEEVQGKGPIILFSGEENGYIEPCGCSEELLGGIARRDTLIRSLRQGGDTVLPISIGDIPSSSGRQNEMKCEVLFQALEEMGYVLHNIGEKDLELDLHLLNYHSSSCSIPLLSSNLLIECSEGASQQNVLPYLKKEIKLEDQTGANLTVGFLGVVSQMADTPKEVEWIDPVTALKRLIPDIRAEVDLLVLVCHGEKEEAVSLAKTFPEIDLIISGHGEDTPYSVKVGRTYVATAGQRGKYVGLYKYDPSRGSSLEFIPLDSKIPEGEGCLALLSNYSAMLERENLLSGIQRVALPAEDGYIGAQSCRACHPKIHEQWATTSHARAYETLSKRGRRLDPDCVSCHTTGLGYLSGFISVAETPELASVGCEACHGPGKRHRDEVLNLEGNKSKPLSASESCGKCHVPDHSPKFQYAEYWPKVAHPKEELALFKRP